MEIVRPYVGHNVNAPSASEYLDIETILKGCNEVSEVANHIGEYANSLAGVGSQLDAKAFSVDGKTLCGIVDECCEAIQSAEKGAFNSVDQLREIVIYKYNLLQEQLNREAMEKDTKK